MAEQRSSKKQTKDRADRLKAALKANLARRKAQAKVRGSTATTKADETKK